MTSSLDDKYVYAVSAFTQIDKDRIIAMTDQQNPLDEVDRIYTSPDPSIDFVRLQIGFWEKLIVLDAATLAASFTAIGMSATI